MGLNLQATIKNDLPRGCNGCEPLQPLLPQLTARDICLAAEEKIWQLILPQAQCLHDMFAGSSENGDARHNEFNGTAVICLNSRLLDELVHLPGHSLSLNYHFAGQGEKEVELVLSCGGTVCLHQDRPGYLNMEKM